MTPIAHDPDTAQAEVFLSLLLAETAGLVDHIEHAQTQVEQLAPPIVTSSGIGGPRNTLYAPNFTRRRYWSTGCWSGSRCWWTVHVRPHRTGRRGDHRGFLVA